MNSPSAIQTASGRYFDVLNPRVEDVKVCDIAHALSHVCRFAGHSRIFWSVANHSMLVADLVATIDARPEFALYALLHDASEAVLGDMPRPLKHFSAFGADFRAIEHNVSDIIADALALPRGYEKFASIKLADNWATAIEAHHLMPAAPWITSLIEELGIPHLVERYAGHFRRQWLDIPETKAAFLERILLAMRRVESTELRSVAQIL